jgi:hypothetical protein
MIVNEDEIKVLVKNTFPIEWWNAPYEIETNVGTED